MEESRNGPLRALKTAALAVAVLATSCVQALHPYIGPFEERLRVTGKGAEVASVRVIVSEPVEYRLDGEGRASVHIPRFGHTCTTYFLFLIPVAGHRPENIPVLEVVVPGRSVRRFTVKQLHRIEASTDGFRELKL
jgi:hypothetical protein